MVRRPWYSLCFRALLALVLVVLSALTVFSPLAFADDPAIGIPTVQIIDPATGKVNWWLAAGLAGTVLITNVGMVILKRVYPDWNKKAWAPPLLGLLVALFGAMLSGQINSVPELVTWIVTGVSTGALASSGRDILVGK